MTSQSFLPLFVSSAAALLGAACATTAEPRMASTQAQTASPLGPTIVQDVAYVQRVETLASRRGVGVVWVNPPSHHLAAPTATR